MKISICIPQYNRIDYLLQSLSIIERQNYPHIEVVISDDCSTDATQQKITAIAKSYRYPIIYHRNEINKGYDANYRQCVELGTGDYCIVIGNDDSIYGDDSMAFLASFLQQHNYPEIGFTNFVEARNTSTIIKRARSTKVIGSGAEVAMNYYSCFSFVGGLIYKKEAFDKFNTSKHDGSIFAQMYLGCLMIASGCRLFSIQEPIVLKDLEEEQIPRKSYLDKIARKWKDYRKVDGGMPSVMHVLICAFEDAGVLKQENIYRIFKRIYTITFPHWILDYKVNRALPEAIGLVQGMNPARVINFERLTNINKFKIYILYCSLSVGSVLFPASLFKRLKSRLYEFYKK